MEVEEFDEACIIPEENGLDALSKVILKDELARLKNSQRNDLILYFGHGCSMREIGERRGVCESAVHHSIRGSIYQKTFRLPSQGRAATGVDDGKD